MHAGVEEVFNGDVHDDLCIFRHTGRPEGRLAIELDVLVTGQLAGTARQAAATNTRERVQNTRARCAWQAGICGFPSGEQGGFNLRHSQSEIHSLTPEAPRKALINVGRDRLIPPFKRRGGVR
jgi:hypothetical protein